MVLVNDEEIPVYKLDTYQSIVVRIAATFDTLPKYLYGVPQNITEFKAVKVKNFLSIIKENGTESTDFEGFLEQNRKYVEKLDIKKDVLEVWITYNKQIENLSEYSSVILDQIGDSLVKLGYFISVYDFIKFWNDRASVRKNIQYNINKVKEDNKRFIEINKTFEEIEDGLAYTEFKTEKVFINMILNLKEISILEIFNYVLLSENVPFAKCKNYYKILKDYLPSEDWAINNEEELLLKVNDKLVVNPSNYKDYTNVGINITEDKNVNVTLKLTTERGYLSKEKFVERFLYSLQPLGDISYSSIEEKEVVGIFYFPQERINTYVFSDLVMNDLLFSTMISIDESSKATKKKTDFSQPWLYIHFEHSLTGTISASITQKVVDRTDAIMREEDADIFPHGEPYIRVRVKGRDKKSIEYFQEIFSKLLVIYNERYNDIVKIYEQFIPDFGIVQEIAVKELKSFDMIPEIFVSNYSRYCNEARYPTIVTDKEAKKYSKEGKEIMVFPRDISETGSVYPSDGKNQHKYVCLNPEYPYPGLQINTKLSNADQFPFLPCCFKTEQSNKVGGTYKHYFFGEELDVKEKRQQDLIVTDKILHSDKYGTLPDNLNKLFQILDNDLQYKYLRVGVDRNYSSFLSSVMIGMDEQTGFSNITEENERDKKLQDIRKELADKNIVSLSRQSCYDMTSEQISKNLIDNKYYMDPKLYTQLLEGFFDCNIYLPIGKE